MKILRKSWGLKCSGPPVAGSVRPVLARAASRSPATRLPVIMWFSVPVRRWNSSGAGGIQVRSCRSRPRTSGTAPPASRIRLMTALSTSASSGLTTRSRSVSVLDGAICSSGTSSPVPGSRYWMRLWWESSSSSSARMPVWRRTSMIAHAQNAWSSSRLRCRCLPPAGSRAQMLPGAACGRMDRTRVCPAAVNSWPGCAGRAAVSSAAASWRHWAAARARTGSTGSRSRVRASIRALRRRTNFRRARSSGLIGQGATHGPHRAGSSRAHSARSR